MLPGQCCTCLSRHGAATVQERGAEVSTLVLGSCQRSIGWSVGS